MKLTILIVTMSILTGFSASTYSQTTKLTFSETNSNLLNVVRKIEEKSEFKFFYNETVNINSPVSVEADNKLITEILDQVLSNTNIKYKVIGHQIALYNKNEMEPFMAVEQQVRRLTGKVIDSSGAALPGVSVAIKGTSTGVITDNEGKYTLNGIAENSTLRFSFVGMKTIEMNYKNQPEINITMQEESYGIDEVVAVGYGTQKKINLTGAVASLKIDDKITSRSMPNVSSGLSGLIPGLSVQQTSGMAGGNTAQLLIRGMGTVNNSTPLIVVDGMPDVDINRINPNDIETISVLKDASSSAIYGSRAANGVILITTKTGKGERSSISYNGNMSIVNPTKWYEQISDYAKAMTLMKRGSDIVQNSQKYTDGMIDQWFSGEMVNPYLFPSTKWTDVLLRTGKLQNHTVSITHSGDTHNIYVSAGAMDEKGMQIQNDYRRYNFRANMEMKIRKNINIGFKMDGQWSDRNSPQMNGIGVGGDSPLNNMFSSAGIVPLAADGRFGAPQSPGDNKNGNNVYAQWMNQNYNLKVWQFNGNVFGEIEMAKGLKARADYGVQYNSSLLKYNDMPYNTYDFLNTQNLPSIRRSKASSKIQDTNSEGHKTLLQGRLTYDKELFRGHQMSIMVGATQEYWFNRSLMASRLDRINPALSEIDAGFTTTQNTAGTSATEGLLSFLGRFNYSIKNKYLVELTARYDGSSKFYSGKKWGFFPSGSLGWRFSEEEFFTSLKNIVGNGKLRVSYGVLGNNSGIGRTQQRKTLGVTNYILGDALTDGYSETKLINENLTWEKTAMANIGLDLSFLNNKLSTSIDVYDRLTTDMIRPQQLSAFFSGYSVPTSNIGSLRNRGIELNLSYMNNYKEFQYSATLNFSYNQSRLEQWNETIMPNSIPFGQGSNVMGYYLNMPYGFLYGAEARGIAQTWEDIYTAPYLLDHPTWKNDGYAPGDVTWKDLNGDGRFTEADRKVLSTQNQLRPLGNVGLTLMGAWKGFDMNILFQGAFGRKDYYFESYMIPESEPWNASFSPTFWDGGNYWTIENRDAQMPRYTGNQGNLRGGNRTYSSYWLQDLSYLRMKNITLGYTLPKKWMEAITFDKVRVYCSADNIFTLTKWKGLDPEKNSVGDETNGNLPDDPYPLMRTITLGVKVDF